MSSPFQAAWMLLKNQVRRGHRGLASNPRVPMTEDAYSDRPYGNISYRESPLHGLEDDDESIDDSGSMPPMSRTLGGTPPPNIGRAGSTNAFEPSSQEYLSDIEQQLQEMGLSPEEINYEINNMTPRNPFPKPAGQNVRGDLMDWAAGAGREAGVPDIVERTEYYDEDGNLRTDLDELSDMHDDDMYEEIHGEPLDENNPAKHTIASTTLRASPRHQRRGQMDSGRPYFKRPGDESSKRMTPTHRLLQQIMRMHAGKEIGF